MIPLQSQIENIERPFNEIKDHLQSHGFTLGGNWDYDHGYFDRSLDDRNKVWLRIPFQVTKGSLEGDTGTNDDTEVMLGNPFVLKHLYEDNVDEEGESGVFSSLVDQFQDPVDPDAKVEDEWIQAAQQALYKIESGLIQ